MNYFNNKNYKKITASIFFIFIAIIPNIFGQTNYATTVLYKDYIKIITLKVPEITLINYTESNAANNLLSAKAISDVKLYIDAGASGMKKSFSGYNDMIPYSSIEANGPKVAIGLESLIAQSGTRLKLELAHNSYFGDINMAQSGLDMLLGGNLSTNNFKYYAPKITLQVAQPLLRDFFGKLDMYQIKDSEYALTIAKLKRDFDNKAVISEYEKLYYRWIMLNNLLQFYKEAVREAENFENLVYKRYENKLVDNDNYQNAKTQTLNYKNAYDNLKLNLKTLIRNIEFFIDTDNIEPDYNEWNIALQNIEKQNISAIRFDTTSQGQICYETQKRAKYALEITKNDSLPDLSLVGSVSFSAFDEGGYFKSFSAMTNAEYFVGFKFSYPLGGKESKAKISKAQDTINMLQADYEKTSRDFDLKIGSYIDRFDTYKKLIINKKELLTSTYSKLKTQNEKFNQGRVSVEDITSTQLDIVILKTELINLEYELIGVVIDYKLASL